MTKSAEWAARVAAWRSSGQKAAEFCEGRDYPAKSLMWWSSYLRRHGGPAPRKGKGVKLTRVVRAPAAASPRQLAAIVVQVERARIEVPAGVDRATLSAVFEALCALRAAR